MSEPFARRVVGEQCLHPGETRRPVSPATMPAAARSRIAAPASSSPTPTNHSTLATMCGQATAEPIPQLSPTMIEGCGPGTCTSSFASIDAWTQFAEIGSTPTSAVLGPVAGSPESDP